MTEDRRDTIKLLQRRQKGNAIQNEWIRTFKKICGINVTVDDFVHLEKTERLKREFYSMVRERSLDSRFVLNKDFDELIEEFEEIAQCKGKQIVLLFHKMDEFIGALRLTRNGAFNNAQSIWHIADEDFALATSDLKSGICLEKNFYDRSGNYFANGIYELTAWGEFNHLWKRPASEGLRQEGQSNDS